MIFFLVVIRVTIPVHMNIITVAEQMTVRHNLCCIFIYFHL